MNTLQFPGGPVVIDEAEVWRKLSRWLGEGHSRAVHCFTENGKLRARLFCRDSGDEFIGSSALELPNAAALPDAVAQALQCAYIRQEQVL